MTLPEALDLRERYDTSARFIRRASLSAREAGLEEATIEALYERLNVRRAQLDLLIETLQREAA